MIQYIVKMEKLEILFNFWLGRKTKNMELFFLTNKRKRREKLKIYISIGLKVSSKQRYQNNRAKQMWSDKGVNRNPGAEVSFLGKIQNPENRLYNLHDATCWSRERKKAAHYREKA